ncbi:retrovirus-related Pol polyprotein from transposon TNT 1-94 [Senna tora]|uniref:Retrovirus-related Pol polyprotein from transposon TNT 1-94 n=1 Tax=Senna tora TaxID=362788 RepID=A0A834W7Q8_9FABA|nr:retrovirus-related Pol polyprotein from transposon TNT 1-94 [Senna tora]
MGRKPCASISHGLGRYDIRRVKIIARGKEEGGEVMALATRTRDGRDQKVVCTHCKKAGHESSNCFALIGYPEWWGDRSPGDSKSGGTSRTKGGKNGARAHAVQTRPTRGSSKELSTAGSMGIQILLDEVAVNFNKFGWIMMHGTFGNANRCQIIAFDLHRAVNMNSEFTEQSF